MFRSPLSVKPFLLMSDTRAPLPCVVADKQQLVTAGAHLGNSKATFAISARQQPMSGTAVDFLVRAFSRSSDLSTLKKSYLSRKVVWRQVLEPVREGSSLNASDIVLLSKFAYYVECVFLKIIDVRRARLSID